MCPSWAAIGSNRAQRWDLYRGSRSGPTVCVCVRGKCVGGLYLLLRQCNTDTERECSMHIYTHLIACKWLHIYCTHKHTHTHTAVPWCQVHSYDNYTRSLITAAGIRLAPLLISCLESLGPLRLHPLWESIWDHKLKQNQVFEGSPELCCAMNWWSQNYCRTETLRDDQMGHLGLSCGSKSWIWGQWQLLRDKRILKVQH